MKHKIRWMIFEDGHWGQIPRVDLERRIGKADVAQMYRDLMHANHYFKHTQVERVWRDRFNPTIAFHVRAEIVR